MEKYPISLIRNTLIEWKYEKKYSNELKTFEVKDQLNGELYIVLKNRIKIINKGGTFDVRIEPVKFHTTSLAMASMDNNSENERLKDLLRNFDNEGYIKAEESESNTVQHTNLFDK